MAETARRVMRLLEKRGLDSGDDPLAFDDPLLANLMAASVRSRIATGPRAGQSWLRLGDRVEPESGGTGVNAQAPDRCVREGGMSLHADVSVPALDRNRLERLARYILRPPISLDRLEALSDGRLSYRLKTRWRDGTTHVVMERHELLERLAPLVPPPRSHQVRYHGILAPCASGRDLVVPDVANTARACEDTDRETGRVVDRHRTCRPTNVERPQTPQTLQAASILTNVSRGRQGAQPARVAPTPNSRRASGPRRLPWADLLQRVFGVDALRCQCGRPMRVLAAITEPTIARRILDCIGLPPRAPPLGPPSTPGRSADPWREQSTPDDFDQTPPDDWDPVA